MAVIPSQAGQCPVYDEQGGKTVHWDTGTRFEINGTPTCLAVKQTVAAGASTICTVTLQAQDLNGVNLAQVFDLYFYLSDSATGAGFSAHVPTGGLNVTAGTAILTKVTNLVLEALTDATGKLVFTITDTARTLYYIVSEVPGTGLLSIGPQLITGNYG
jgi:hypothetical protein